MPTATNLIANPPALDALPAFSAFAPSAPVSLTSPSPRVISQPTFGVFVPSSLVAASFVDASPLLEALPAFAVTLFSAVSLTTGSPIQGAVTIKQRHPLFTAAIVDSSPIFGILAIRQRHALVGASLADSSPIISVPGVSRTLTASSYINTPPVITGAALGKVLVARLYVDSPPVLGRGALNSGLGLLDIVLGDRVLDYGLNVIHTDCNAIYVCLAEPRNYADVLAYALGVKRFSFGMAFGSPVAASPGRMITSAAIADGRIMSGGTMVRWAAVDTTHLRLLAEGKLTSSLTVSAGEVFTLSPITIQLTPHIG